jgi:hypothetical protein
VEPTIPPENLLLGKLQNLYGGDLDTHRVVTPVKKKMKKKNQWSRTYRSCLYMPKVFAPVVGK